MRAFGGDRTAAGPTSDLPPEAGAGFSTACRIGRGSDPAGSVVANPFEGDKRAIAEGNLVDELPFSRRQFGSRSDGEAPTLFGLLKRCDLHGLDEADARARLKNYLAPAAKPTHAPFPGGVKAAPSLPRAGAPAPFPGKAALSNIPIRVPLHFMGRDDALTAIEAALKRYEGRVAITALHGLRGVGKTTLAALREGGLPSGQKRTRWKAG